MLLPNLGPIFKQVKHAINEAESRADDRSKSAEEAQQKVAVAIQSIANEFKAYEKNRKKPSAESAAEKSGR
jgi:Sec-independent protein translocase protein TatA